VRRSAGKSWKIRGENHNTTRRGSGKLTRTHKPLSADAGRKREKIPKGVAQLTTFSYINNDFDGPDVVLFPHFRVPVLC